MVYKSKSHQYVENSKKLCCLGATSVASIMGICLWTTGFDYFSGITWIFVHFSDYLKNASNKMDYIGVCCILVRIIFLKVSFESWSLLDNYCCRRLIVLSFHLLLGLQIVLKFFFAPIFCSINEVMFISEVLNWSS